MQESIARGMGSLEKVGVVEHLCGGDAVGGVVGEHSGEEVKAVVAGDLAAALQGLLEALLGGLELLELVPEWHVDELRPQVAGGLAEDLGDLEHLVALPALVAGALGAAE